MQEGKKLGFTSLNVKMMYDFFIDVHDYIQAVLFHMIMHSDGNGFFRGSQKDIAEKMGISTRTVYRALKRMEKEDAIKRVESHKWKIQIWFAPDEEFEQATNAPKGTCFTFFDERDEFEEEYDDEHYKKLIERWNQLPKYEKKKKARITAG